MTKKHVNDPTLIIMGHCLSNNFLSSRMWECDQWQNNTESCDHSDHYFHICRQCDSVCLCVCHLRRCSNGCCSCRGIYGSKLGIYSSQKKSLYTAAERKKRETKEEYTKHKTQECAKNSNVYAKNNNIFSLLCLLRNLHAILVNLPFRRVGPSMNIFS